MLVRMDDHPAADHVGGCIGPDLAVGLVGQELSRYRLATVLSMTGTSRIVPS
jgi:hypothetical protein